MSSSILDHRPRPGRRAPAPAHDRPAATRFQRGLRTLLCRKLDRIVGGRLAIVDGDEHLCFGHGEPAAVVTVHHPRFWSACALGGTVGAGAGYARGDWDCDDLTALIRILCRNQQVILDLDGGLGRIQQPIRSLLHRFNRNTVEGSARNIHAHYDIGDELYRRMLDPTLMYSAAIYPQPAASLEEAQAHKNELLCRALDLGADDHLLEIGTGWGGFAIHAATTRGCRVTTTTISREQYATAQRRVARAGLEDRITVLDRDYRQLEGRYDKLVSIEMIEAVGAEYYPTFFERCRSLLVEDGLAVLQAITIQDHRFEGARREVDFIKRFIFPGCCIPSVAALTQAAAEAGDLHCLGVEDYGPHYARTLAEWRRRFDRGAEALDALGYDDHFRRLWTFYLAYCEGAFAEGTISMKHLRFARSGYRHPDTALLGYA